MTFFCHVNKILIKLNFQIIYCDMAIYCWGSTPHGELGLGGIPEEEEQVKSNI